MAEEILQAEEGAMRASLPLQLAESAPCMRPQRCENLRNDALIFRVQTKNCGEMLNIIFAGMLLQ